MNYQKIGAGILFIVLGVVFFLETKNFPNAQGRDVGPDSWPKILILLLIIMSISLIVQSIRNKSKDTDTQVKFDKELLKPLAGIVLCIVFVFFFKKIGFVLSVFLFYILANLIMRNKFDVKVISLILLQAVILIGVIYLIFVQLLSVSLPKGIFFF